TLMAKIASAVGIRERHHHHVAHLDPAHVLADRLDDANGFMTHAATAFGGREILVRPQVAAADAGTHHADQGIGGMPDRGVWHVLDADVARAVHHGCQHGITLFELIRIPRTRAVRSAGRCRAPTSRYRRRDRAEQAFPWA